MIDHKYSDTPEAVKRRDALMAKMYAGEDLKPMLQTLSAMDELAPEEVLGIGQRRKPEPSKPMEALPEPEGEAPEPEIQAPAPTPVAVNFSRPVFPGEESQDLSFKMALEVVQKEVPLEYLLELKLKASPKKDIVFHFTEASVHTQVLSCSQNEVMLQFCLADASKSFVFKEGIDTLYDIEIEGQRHSCVFMGTIGNLLPSQRSSYPILSFFKKKRDD